MNNLVNKYAPHGELLMWLVLASMFPVLLIWQFVHMPKASILFWAIPALIVATIGFILNSRHINNQIAARDKAFEDMTARHKKMLDDALKEATGDK